MAYINQVDYVIDELWSLMKDDKAVEELATTKRIRRRCGILRRIFFEAVMESSLGVINSQMFFFNGQIYVPLDNNDFYAVIYRLRAFYIKGADEDGLYDDSLKRHCMELVMSKKLVIDNSIIVFRNCVLDVKTRQTYNFHKDFVQVNKVDYDYEPDMRTYKWYSFLNSVLPEKEKRDMLQMFLGACLVNRYEVKIETMLILLGSGANGKSVIQETVRGVFGEENVSKSGLKELCHGGSVGDQTIMIINGKRLNYCSEIQGGEFDHNVDRLKAIISGEPVYGRLLYSNRSEARYIPLIMANANTMPSIRDNSYGMQRRISVIEFEITVPVEKRNPHLADEMREEYPGIMNWILDGRDMFAENGYKLPQMKNGQTAIEEKTASMSTPIIFMRMNGWLPGFENVEMEALMFQPSLNLYNSYIRWCEENVKEMVTKPMFTKELVNAGYIRTRQGGKNGFKVYSKSYVQKLAAGRFDDKGKLIKKAKMANPKAEIMTVDGELWATSFKALSAITNVGMAAWKSLNLRGKMRQYDCVRAYKEKKIYSISRCIEMCNKEKVVISDKEKIQRRLQQRELKYERYLFNQAMQHHGLPYRKYSLEEPQITNAVVVDDTTTLMEAYERAHEEYGFDLSKVRKGAQLGAGGRGGKGFSKDLLESVDNTN